MIKINFSVYFGPDEVMIESFLHDAHAVEGEGWKHGVRTGYRLKDDTIWSHTRITYGPFTFASLKKDR